MTAHIYGRGQMVIPAKIRKAAGLDQGDVVSIQVQGDGRVLLVRLERPKPLAPVQARIIRRRGKHSLLDVGRPVTREEINQALADFP
jgi:AbrB family looped-hinge helix DNA binding protein